MSIAWGGEVGAIIRQHGVDPVGYARNEFPQEVGGSAARGLFHQAGEGELGSAIHGDKEVELAFGRAHFGQIDMEVADGIFFKLLFLARAGAIEIRQAANAVALQAAMKGRASEVRKARLQGVEAVIQRQKGVFAESDDHRFFLGA